MTRIVVLHAYCGCESGCCGHIVEVSDGRSQFTFAHPYNGNVRAFVRKVVTDRYSEKHVADIDWDNCIVSEE